MKEREEQTVIAADVDRQRFVRLEEAVGQHIRKAGEVTVHRVGRRWDVDVMTEVLGRNLIRHLDQTAIQTDVDIERETRLLLRELLGAQEPVRERVVTEREKEIEIVALEVRHVVIDELLGLVRDGSVLVRRASHQSTAGRSRLSRASVGSQPRA